MDGERERSEWDTIIVDYFYARGLTLAPEGRRLGTVSAAVADAVFLLFASTGSGGLALSASLVAIALEDSLSVPSDRSGSLFRDRSISYLSLLPSQRTTAVPFLCSSAGHSAPSPDRARV